MEFYSILLVIVGCAFITSASTPEKDTSSLCKLSATKRMLNSLGMASDSPCLLNNKRDVANLVTSFLENAFVRPEKKRDAFDNFVELLSKKSDNEKRSKYCCSPSCDGFMARLGRPDKKLINCVH